MGDGKREMAPGEARLQPASASWPDWCPTQSPQAGTWQKGEEERSLTDWSCHLMKAKLIWGRPQATDVGGGPAKTVWRGKGVMGVLLDTGGLGEP